MRPLRQIQNLEAFPERLSRSRAIASGCAMLDLGSEDRDGQAERLDERENQANGVLRNSRVP